MYNTDRILISKKLVGLPSWLVSLPGLLVSVAELPENVDDITSFLKLVLLEFN